MTMGDVIIDILCAALYIVIKTFYGFPLNNNNINSAIEQLQYIFHRVSLIVEINHLYRNIF